jgi:hypothetical protein
MREREKRMAAVASIAAMVLGVACSRSTTKETGGDAMAITRLPGPAAPTCATGSSSESPCYVNDPWSGGADREQFFHLSEGSEIFPYSWLLALQKDGGANLFDPAHPPRGLLPDPNGPSCTTDAGACNTYGAPVGMSVAKTRDLELLGLEMFGFNCAACHVGETSYQGKTYRILGAPNLFDIIGFLTDLKASVAWTLGSLDRVLAFIGRAAANGDMALDGAPEELRTFAKVTPAALEKGSPASRRLVEELRTAYGKLQAAKLAPSSTLHLVPPDGSGGEHGVVPAAPGMAKPAAAPAQPVHVLVPVPATGTKVPGAKPSIEVPERRLEASGAPAQVHLEDPNFERALRAAANQSVGGSVGFAQEIPSLRDVSLDRQIQIAQSYLLNLGATFGILEKRLAAIGVLIQGAQQSAVLTPPGPGRVDAFMTTHNSVFTNEDAWAMTSPVSYPRIWELGQISWFHWDGNTTSLTERNIGQALGLGAVVDEAGDSTVRIGNIQTLERLARKLAAPAWPFGPLDTNLVGAGARIFADKCAGCHGVAADSGLALAPNDPDGGTDPNRATSFAKTLADGTPYYEALKNELGTVMVHAYDYEDAAADAREDIGAVKWRAPGSYAARPLDGVWATAPYLHNGSVATLADLLEPPASRPRSFSVGSRTFDPDRVGYSGNPEADAGDSFPYDASGAGNDPGGHDYGTMLEAGDKRALLEYLKSR